MKEHDKLAQQKSEAVLVTKRRKFEYPKLILDGPTIQFQDRIWYVDLLIDKHWNFRDHVRGTSTNRLYVSVSICYFLFLCLCLYVSVPRYLSLLLCLNASISTFLSLRLYLDLLSLRLCLYATVSTSLSLRLCFNVLCEIFTCVKCAIL